MRLLWRAFVGALIAALAMSAAHAQLGIGLSVNQVSIRLKGTKLVTPLGIFFEGDSITAKVGTNTAGYVDQFATNTGIAVQNGGRAGDTVATMSSTYGSDGTGAAYNAATRNTLFLLGGTNDLGNDGVDDLTLRSRVQAFVSTARASGYRVIVSTLLPRSDASWNSTKEGYRLAFNAWLLGNWSSFANGVVDFGSIPEAQDPTSTVFFQDKLHPTNRLSRRMAEFLRSAFANVANLNDTSPDAFSFTAIANATSSTAYSTPSTPIVGFTADADISVTGGTYSINGGSFTASPGRIQPYDEVVVRQTSSAADATATNAALTIGGISGTFTVTTAAGITPFNATPMLGSFTYSNSNKTLVESAAAQNGRVLTASAMSGKKAFVVRIDSLGTGSYTGVGLSDAAASTGGPGFDTHSLALIEGSQVWSNGYVTNGPALAAGQTVAWLVDTAAKKAWFTLNGTNFYGGGSTVNTAAQVAAGTNGIDVSTILAAGVYGVVGSQGAGSKGYTIVAYPWTLPSGFTQQ